MEDHLKAAEEFVKNAKENVNEQLELVVPSYALRREVAKKVNARYKEHNVFTEFKKNSDTLTIKKWKKRNNPP